MATLSTNKKNKARSIQFKDRDGSRRTIYLGKLPMPAAKEFCRMVERLNEAASIGLPPDSEATKWVADLAEKFLKKLSKVGLAPERTNAALGEFIAEYLARRAAGGAKKNTVKFLKRVGNRLVAHFGADKLVRAVTPADARAFRETLLAKGSGLLAYTAARLLAGCGTVFIAAAEAGLTAGNPFRKVTITANPADKKQYVPADHVRLLCRLADLPTRVSLALSRFGGMRCPTEVLSLRWDHVDLDGGVMVVLSPKTEHILGKDRRTVPIFAALRPYLLEARAAAPADAVYVVPGGYQEAANAETGWKSVKLRSDVEQLIKRAGLKQWPRLFNNLRGSCADDLHKVWASYLVVGWMGHSLAVAGKHYLSATAEDMRAAAGLSGDDEGSVKSAVGPARPGSSGVSPVRHPDGPEAYGTQEMLGNKAPSAPRQEVPDGLLAGAGRDSGGRHVMSRRGRW